MAKSSGKGGPPVHTTPNPAGKGWVNKAGGEVTSSHRLKEPAAAAGRQQAKAAHTEHVIHKSNGQIGEKNSYGNDPCPPKDKK